MRLNGVYAAGWLSIIFLPLKSAPLTVAFGMSLPNLFFYLFFLLLCITLLLNNSIKKCWNEPGSYAFLFLAWWVMASTFVNGAQQNLFSNMITVFGALGFYFVGVYISSATRHPSRWEFAVFIGSVAAAVVGLLHYYAGLPLFSFETGTAAGAISLSGWQFSGLGYTGLIPGAGSYNIWLLAGLMVAHRWLLRANSGAATKLFSMLAIFIILIACAISQSRSGWLTLSLFLLVYWIGLFAIHRRSLHRRASRIWMLLFVTLLSATVLYIGPFFHEISNALISFRYDSFYGRLVQYVKGFQIIADHPVFGAGDVHVFVRGEYRPIHNTFLMYAACYGLMAAFALAAFYIYLIFKAYKRALFLKCLEQRKDALALFSASLAMIIAVDLYSGIASKFLFALLGLIAGSLNNYQIKISNQEGMPVQVSYIAKSV